jgi:hypothetical protein
MSHRHTPFFPLKPTSNKSSGWNAGVTISTAGIKGSGDANAIFIK